MLRGVAIGAVVVAFAGTVLVPLEAGAERLPSCGPRLAAPKVVTLVSGIVLLCKGIRSRSCLDLGVTVCCFISGVRPRTSPVAG
jgi:hypothetical protein